jgi:dipeptidyl aminopeptidase/acylaminoacyl peptidase
MARKIELDDLTRFVAVSDPQLSPTLDKVAFVTVRADGKRDAYESTIWIVSGADGKPVRFLSGGKDRHPRWSPDGRQLLFVSDRGMEEGEMGAGLWVTPVYGGEPRPVVRMEGGVEQPQWSADGSRIFFISGVGEPEKDVKVIDRIPLWSDGGGFTYHRRRHLHVVDAASGVVTRLTDGDMDVSCFTPSNGGLKVAYTAPCDDLRPPLMDIHVLDAETGESSRVAGGYTVSSLCWSPDDGDLAFLGSDQSRGGATHFGVWTLPAGGGDAENLTKDLGKGCTRRAYYDLRSIYTGAPNPVWDGDHIYFPVSDGGVINLFRIGLHERVVEPVVTAGFSLEEFSVRGGVVAYTRVTGTEPAEVWLKDESGERRMTGFNDGLLSKLDLSGLDHFEFEASDGQKVEGWVLKPHGLKEGERRPAILDIHGGPKSKFGDSFMFEHQLYAAAGYAVVILNPRGSDGYSEEFADIRGRYGTRDYTDIMEGVDHVLASYGFVDPERLGVTGLSYGGFMTNWIVTQTGRFKAAVSQNGISHWPSFYGTSDIGFYFTPDQVGGEPWTNEEGYREKSPLSYASNVETPTMFVHSYEDYRCWMDQSIIFYTALKHLGKEARLALFMEGAHVFRSSARPSIRRRRYELMIDWFDSHLKGGAVS